MSHSWDLGRQPETVGLPAEYFRKRGIFLDCRGPLVIDATSNWGFEVAVYSESHEVKGWPVLGRVIPYGVTVDKGAWIGSRAILAGCHIGEGAIVAAGTVVRGQDVASYTMVAGNPARVIARWDGKQWVYEEESVSGYKRRLE